MDDSTENTSGFPQDAESFRSVPHDAEAFGNVPHDSVTFRNVPKASETDRTAPHRSERTEHHTLTVRDVARMFEHADVARTERSITNWCQPDRNGVSRLDCYYDPNEHRWLITRQSAERAIQEEQAKAHIEHGHPPADQPEDVPKRAEAEPTPPKDEASTPHQVRKISELEAEVRDLSIASGIKDLYIKRLEAENENLQDKLEKNVDQLIRFNRPTGRLEGVLGLPEPERREGDYMIDEPRETQGSKHDDGRDPDRANVPKHAEREGQGTQALHDHKPAAQHTDAPRTPHDAPVSIPVRSISETSPNHAPYENASHPDPEPFNHEEQHP